MLRPRVLAVLLLVVPAIAQETGGNPRNFNASAFGQRVELGPNWLVERGDNPDYASPRFDDSKWKTVSTKADFLSEPDPIYRGTNFCWYRIHVHLRPEARGVAVSIVNLADPYQIFVNGILIGGNGNMADHGLHSQHSLIYYGISDGLLAASHGEILVALRCSLRDRGNYSPRRSAVEVSLEGRDAAPRHANYVASHRVMVTAVLASMSLLTGLVSLALCLAFRAQREYLAITMCLLVSFAFSALWIWVTLKTSSLPNELLGDALTGLKMIALIEFVRLVLKMRRNRWLAAFEVGTLCFQFLYTAGLYTQGFSTEITLSLCTFAVQAILTALLVRGWIQGNQEARLLLPAILFASFTSFNQVVGYLAFLAHLIDSPFALATLYFGSYPVHAGNLGDLAFYVTILLFIVLRTIRIARDRAKVAGEIEAAQTVQQLLLARSAEPTPGFEVESVYQPASETGGDFFLVSPASDASLVAIVGDVSGKGLTAAMRVSMIIGVLRREESREPAEILQSLNAALLTQRETGFTTACCVRLQRDGSYTVANAGHLSPYVDGIEIATTPQLPLGLSAEPEYTQISGRLPEGKKLVLLSDGVVEARSAKGEIYGFERTAKLTLMPAQQIADEAKRFGQEDDITVLSIACCA